MTPTPLERDVQFRSLSAEQREQLMIQVAKRYYFLDMTMSDLAKELGLTRWQASRLLVEARESGLVKIDIVPHAPRLPRLESALQQTFNLRETVVVANLQDDDGIIVLDAIARAAANFLAGLGRLPTIGVSWGRTMTAVARHLSPGWSEGAEVVLINGAASFKSSGQQTNNVAELFAQAARGTATNLPVPAIVGHAATRDALACDPTIAAILAQAASVPIICFGIGAFSRESVLVQSGFLSDQDIALLHSKGAVGDILGHFIDRYGNIVDDGLDRRTISASLESCRQRDFSIGVAAGRHKLEAIFGCLTARYVNVLVTDELTAQGLLEFSQSE
jgi:deoxyribonucleoside regulator